MPSIALRALSAVQLIFVLVLSPGLAAQSPQGLLKSATNGADLYGFMAQFQKRLDALGEISVDEFLERYERPEQYVDSLSYDPVSDEFSAKP